MKKIVIALIIAGFGLAGCNEDKPTETTKPATKAEPAKTGDGTTKRMIITKREMPVPKPYKKGDAGD